ncbi:hypothetical protein C5Z25_00650 [Lactobacillus sp. CBA3605]|nr:hypothetical protein C5Z25_00650 [Lactobacillus sp. CBA3605]
MILISLVVISPLILNQTAILGVDGYFQYNRIYDAAMQLKNYNFSFLNLYSFQQAGRIVNQVYSPLLTYLFGAILLMAGNWMNFQIISVMLVSFVAGITMYYAARRLQLNFKVSVAAGVLYLTSLSIVGFVYNVSWRATALALVPLLVGSMVDFYHGNWSLKSMLGLGVIVGGLAQAQILTTILALPLLIPFFVVGLVKSSQKLRQLGYLLVAILIALILSLNVILPYLDIAKNSVMLPPTMLPLINGISNVIVPFVGRGDSLGITIFCLIFYIGLAGLFCFWQRITGFSKILFITATIYIILGTNLIPWQVIDDSFPVLENYLQLPRRFTIVGMSFLILGSLALFRDIAESDNNRGLNQVVDFTSIVFAIASAISLAVALAGTVTRYNQPDVSISEGLGTGPNNVHGKRYLDKPVRSIVDIQPAFHGKQLSDLIRIVDRTTPDYMPITKYNEKVPYYDLYNDDVIAQKRNFKYTVKAGGSLQLEWQNKRKSRIMGVPVASYGNTQLRLNGKLIKNTKVKQTKIGTVRVRAKTGKNSLQVSYHPRTATKVGITLSLIAWFTYLLIVLWLFVRGTLRFIEKY